MTTTTTTTTINFKIIFTSGDGVLSVKYTKAESALVAQLWAEQLCSFLIGYDYVVSVEECLPVGALVQWGAHVQYGLGSDAFHDGEFVVQGENSTISEVRERLEWDDFGHYDHFATHASIEVVLEPKLKLIQTYDYYGEAWDFCVMSETLDREIYSSTAYDRRNAETIKESLRHKYGSIPEVECISHPDVDWVDFI